MLDPGEIDPLYGVGEERHLVVIARPLHKLRRNVRRSPHADSHHERLARFSDRPRTSAQSAKTGLWKARHRREGAR